MSLQFEKHGHSFRAEKLNARQQGHLARRLAPLLPPMAPIFEEVMSKGGANALKASVFEFLGKADAFANALANLKDEHWDAILDLTLGSVQVRTNTSPEVWAPLWQTGVSKPFVMDLDDMGKLLPIVVQVIQFNLGNFIDGFLTRHEEPEVPASSGVRFPAARTGS